jgi:hypothetical protein
MIYLATFNKKSRFRHPQHKRRSLIFIEAEDRLGLEKVVALVRALTEGDFEESSVEIIGQKAWDTAKIKHPWIKFHRLD